MTSWTSFVGQVARLRRLIVRAFARATQRRAPVADEPVVAAEEPPSGGPPAHWVERVRRGAPGLLEPSLRSQGVPVRPTAEELVPPQPEDETKLEPPPPVPEEVESNDVPAEPAVVSRPPTPRARAASSRKASPLRKVIRRMRIPSGGRAAAVGRPPDPAPDDVPVEVSAATSPVPSPDGSPVAKVPDRPRAPDESRPAPVRAVRPAVEHNEPAPAQQRTTVVEFEAPLARSRTVHAERAVRDGAVIERAAEPPAAELAPVERLFRDAGIRRAREAAVATPAPRHATDVQPAQEPAPQRALPPVEPSFGAAPRSRSRDDPLRSLDSDPWPELPPPLDEAEGEVDAALRAWARQQRLDREQTRL